MCEGIKVYWKAQGLMHLNNYCNYNSKIECLSIKKKLNDKFIF